MVGEHNLEASRSTFAELGFHCTMGHRYFGGFVGEAVEKDKWLEKKAAFWKEANTGLRAAAPAFLREFAHAPASSGSNASS